MKRLVVIVPVLFLAAACAHQQPAETYNRSVATLAALCSPDEDIAAPGSKICLAYAVGSLDSYYQLREPLGLKMCHPKDEAGVIRGAQYVWDYFRSRPDVWNNATAGDLIYSAAEGAYPC